MVYESFIFVLWLGVEKEGYCIISYVWQYSDGNQSSLISQIKKKTSISRCQQLGPLHQSIFTVNGCEERDPR